VLAVLRYYYYYYYYCVCVYKTYCSTMQHISWSVSLVINFSSSRFVRRSSVITFLFPNTIERSLSVKYFTTSKYSKLLLIYINVRLCVYRATIRVVRPSPTVSVVVYSRWATGQGNRVWVLTALRVFFNSFMTIPTQYYVYLLGIQLSKLEYTAFENNF